MNLNRLGHKIEMVLLIPTFLSIMFIEASGAQVSQRLQYTPELNSQWSKGTSIQSISNNGEWIAFSEFFSENEQCLWVMASNGSKKFKLPDSDYLNFSLNNEWFAGITKRNKLLLVNLKNFQEKRYSNILSYSFSSDGTYLAMIQQTGAQDKELLLLNLNNEGIEHFSNLETFRWHPIKNQLFKVIKKPENTQLIQHDAINLHNEKLLIESSGSIENLDISASGNSLIFQSTQEGIINLYHYNLVEDNLKVLSEKTILENYPGYTLSTRKCYITDNDSKVLFYIKKTDPQYKELDANVQTWKSKDPWIEPRMQIYLENEANYLLSAWFPVTGKVSPIETEKLPSSALDKDHEFALVYDQLKYEPLYKFYSNVDLFWKNIQTGDTTLVSKDQYMNNNFVVISPNGQHISYFKNNDWWLYTSFNGRTLNLTSDLEENFENTENNSPWGNPGWLKNSEKMIFYDEFDIWLMSSDGKSKKRITKGRETNKTYRILKNQALDFKNSLEINPIFPTQVYSLANGIALTVFDNETYKSGIAIWKDNQEVKPLFWVEGKMDQTFIDASPGKIFYRQQRFDHPITINSFDLKKKKSHLIYQTNKELLQYDLGTSEFIDYTLSDGTRLRGCLIYPANYNPQKKYPMIVKIYERESRNINKFEPPSDFMDVGFNLMNFILNDYFVLLPDISYAIGNPGISAFNSVTAAVTEVLKKEKIDKRRIGLIGHSFGGYETAFIVTQTDLFATAVAGAPVTDFVNYYHDVNWEWNLTQMWRIENQQFRMGDSFYRMKENYYANSPLTNVERITTPLLLWTGKMDTNINWNQSVNMFLALKRLGKEAELLLYEDEAHTLLKKENQIHLTSTIYQWMETYLKE
jgi:dipeptidyl aminopeptidase/acylaminoacyl peptidase